VVTRRTGQVRKGRTVRVISTGLNQADPRRGQLDVDGVPIDITMTHELGSLAILGFASDDSFFVLAEKVVVQDTLQVDQTVRHYDAQGVLLGLARVPLQDQFAYVEHNVTVGADDGVYALVTRPDRLEVQRLHFVPSLAPILPEAAAAVAASPPGLLAAATPCTIDPATVVRTAWRYRDNQTFLSDANINGPCADRGKPRYLGAPGEYTSVAYDWGGFDTVAEFNHFMQQGFQAGDFTIGPVQPCSRGVDCSGFVCRCWGLTSKRNTDGLPDVCQRLPARQALKQGDILNSPRTGGKGHVTLFSHIDARGIWAWEATTWGGRDRVIWRPHPDSFYEGFTPLRFNRLCDP
jgi:hypothetical protein